MKTPEEIKRYLANCDDKTVCSECYSEWRCKNEADALAYIQQLEADLEIAKIQNQYISEVASAYEKDIEKLERERDAAVKDVAVIKLCHVCKHDKNSVDESDICWSCVNKCYWEWRGLCKENGGSEDA